MEAAPIEDIVAVWERQPLFADQAEALVEAQRAGRLAQDPAALARLLRTAGQGVLEPVWHELLTLELPLLAIAGARDDGYVARRPPHRRHARRERARRSSRTPGHAPQLQRPAAVAELIAAFRDELG